MAPAGDWSFPFDVLRTAPIRRQVFLGGDALTCRTSPLRPTGISSGGADRIEQQEYRQETDNKCKVDADEEFHVAIPLAGRAPLKRVPQFTGFMSEVLTGNYLLLAFEHVLSSRLLFLRDSFAKRKDVIKATHYDQPIRNSWAGHHHLANGICCEQFVLRAGSYDEDIPILARQINLAIGGNGRCRKGAAFTTKSLLVKSLTGIRIVGRHDALIRARVEYVNVNYGRRHIRTATLFAPGN